MTEQKKETKVDIEIKGKIDLPKLDIDYQKYIGQESKIDSVETHEGSFGYFVKVTSEVVDTIENPADKEKPIELRATGIFGLQTDANGDIGWGEDTKLDKYLKKMGVSHFNELPGKTFKVQTKDGKDDKVFLSVN